LPHYSHLLAYQRLDPVCSLFLLYTPNMSQILCSFGMGTESEESEASSVVRGLVK
jgi:hypothetical protein